MLGEPVERTTTESLLIVGITALVGAVAAARAHCRSCLGHASVQTTGDVYADWDIDQLADTMRAVLEDEN